MTKKKGVKRLKVAFLKISSFVGYSLGAKHVYGTLIFGSEYLRLERVLTAEEAEAERADGHVWSREGSKTDRFLTRKQLIGFALSVYKTHHPEAEALVEGNPGYIEPHPVLDGPEWFKKRAGELLERAQQIGYWDRGHEDEMDTISDEWDSMVMRR